MSTESLQAVAKLETELVRLRDAEGKIHGHKRKSRQ